MGWNPGQSLRGFAASQPPLLMFTLCLMAFGLTMVILAYLIGENEVPNPDVRMDWNKFLKKLTELEVCLPMRHLKNFNSSFKSETGAHVVSSLFINSTNSSSTLRFVDQSKSMSAALSNVVDRVNDDDMMDDSAIVNISVRIPLWISGDVNVLMSAPTLIRGSISGKQLGLDGKLSTQQMNVSLSFPSLLNISCEKWCRIVNQACLTIHVSSLLLPHTSRSPPKCEQGEIMLEEGAAVDFVEQCEIPSNKVCQEGARLHLEYIPDSQLTEMLTIHERSIVNLHLMHTSYFMFVMVMTLVCYALIKGRYRSPKGISMEKLPLDA